MKYHDIFYFTIYAVGRWKNLLEFVILSSGADHLKKEYCHLLQQTINSAKFKVN